MASSRSARQGAGGFGPEELRGALLALIATSKAPVSAYYLAGQLATSTGRSLGPPMIYRALDRLAAEGLVHRLEQRRAYVAIPNGRPAAYLICQSCNSFAAIKDPPATQLLTAWARSAHFRLPGETVIELSGVCESCATRASRLTASQIRAGVRRAFRLQQNGDAADE